MKIREYRPEDRADAYHICLKTGDRGNDGEPYYAADPDALGRIYVGPYLTFQPELSLMLEDSAGVCGYALAALDSRAFYDRYEREWRPDLCHRFPAPVGDPAGWSRVESIYHLYHHPNYFCPPPYESYPSHLHIDLLARARRKGLGRRLMDELMDRLQNQGSPGVHLGLGATNDRAYQFYTTLGFSELARQGDPAHGAIYMGKELRRS